jgi:GGDEF domain-containing protein
MGGDEFILARSEEKRQNRTKSSRRSSSLCPDEDPDRYPCVRCHALYRDRVLPQDAQDSETLIRNADIALYQAKQKGCSRYVFYQKDENEAGRQENQD